MSGVSVLAGNGTEGRGRGSAKSSNFMQPSGLCSELDSNLFLCDSQAGEISIIKGLDGTCDVLLSIGEIYRSFGVHKKHHSMAPVSVQESEENLTSVADYIKHTVDEVKALTGRKTTNGPDGTIASKTAASIQMIADGVKTLNKNNHDFIVDLKSCMTGQVESLHSTHHHVMLM